MSRLFLSSLKLSHYRSHQVSKLELDGRPIALFGLNGAGKTNILEAVSMFSPGRGMRRAAAVDMVRRPEALGWKLNGILHSLSHLHEVETWSEGGARQVKIDEKPASQLALGRIARVLWLVPSMDRLWIEGADGRRRFLDRIALSFEPLHAEASLKYEKAMRERNRLLKDQVQDAHWYKALEKQMATAGEAIIRNRKTSVAKLLDAQQKSQSAFPAAELILTHAEGELPEIAEGLEEAFSSGRARDMAAGRTLVGPHRADLEAIYAAKGVPAKDCSTGEQKALLVSLILANARGLAEDIGMPPLLLLDEVAAHLDVNRRAALYDEICALGAQAWMTGTGPELFETLGDRAQYFEVLEEDGISRCEPALTNRESGS
ncbi:MAG: DNA replication/repair protein RecF [Paracoccaceae bacterium]|nr:DNA replication/repair protein RecF [Paracoccaceae bacterium]MDG2257126.1 DNA replication/repair protein RecF [Paracoccaceae bacterium]